LHLAWDFTPDCTITLLGGLFKPEAVYKDVAPAANNPSDDYIYLLGANLKVAF
jgi:hypothetical protein